jgi:ADP-ribosylglycohydrolase
MKAKGMLLAAFVADSLALGPHWIYDTDTIDQTFGRVKHLAQPGPQSFHKTKSKGELTHYGDQMLVLMSSVATHAGFDLEWFYRTWRTTMEDYTGYLDHATKDTLANIANGKNAAEAGSNSSDLGGASRIAPLVYLYRENLPKLISSAKEQTAMTHNHPAVVQSAAYFALVAAGVLQGTTPVDALTTCAEDLPLDPALQAALDAGLKSRQQDTREAIKGFGQMCAVQAAFPSVIHLISKYEDDFSQALVENVMAGGDSAARGMLVGLILGAHHGPAIIPRDWLSELKAYPQIKELLDQMD